MFEICQSSAGIMNLECKKQHGYFGFESARNELGITISYWETIEDIKNWKANLDHLEAKGKNKWYSWYKVRICKVEREYEFNSM